MKRIVIFSPFNTHPSESGPVTRIMNRVELLDDLGYEVFYAYLSVAGVPSKEMVSYWGDRLTVFQYRHPAVYGSFSQRMRACFRKWLPKGNYALKQNCLIDDWFDLSIETSWGRYLESVEPDIVFCHYAYLSRIFEWTPDSILRILDTHDRFANRFRVATAAGKPNDWFSTCEREECRGLRRADRVIAVCEEDHQYFTHQLELESYCVPTIFSPKCAPEAIGSSILFVGNKNTANVRAVEWFLEEAWPNVLRLHPGAKLVLVGSVCEVIPDAVNVQKLGKISRIDLLYEQCRLAINPVPSGSGLAVKCLEAISYKRPVVATTSGARGLDAFKGKCLWIADNGDSFAAYVCHLLSNTPSNDNFSDRCHQLLMKWNQSSTSSLLKAISSALQ